MFTQMRVNLTAARRCIIPRLSNIASCRNLPVPGTVRVQYKYRQQPNGRLPAGIVHSLTSAGSA